MAFSTASRSLSRGQVSGGVEERGEFGFAAAVLAERAADAERDPGGPRDHGRVGSVEVGAAGGYGRRRELLGRGALVEQVQQMAQVPQRGPGLPGAGTGTGVGARAGARRVSGGGHRALSVVVVDRSWPGHR